MTNEVMTRFMLRTKTSEEWEAIKNTDVPLKGELCFVSDLNKSKLGDGYNTFYDLPWHNTTPEELEEIQNQLTKASLYSTNTPTSMALGGIPDNWTCTDKPVTEVIDELLHPNVDPLIYGAITGDNIKFVKVTDDEHDNLNKKVYIEKGNTVTVDGLDVEIVHKGSNEFEYFHLKCSNYDMGSNNTIFTKTNDDLVNGRNHFALSETIEIATDTYFWYSIPNTGSGFVLNSSCGEIHFIYPYYHGLINTDDPTEEIIKGLNKDISTKENKTYKYTLNDNRLCVAYPAEYGYFNKILDNNDLNITDLFNCKTVSITGLDGIPQDYYVYTLDEPVTLSNFTFKFNY